MCQQNLVFLSAFVGKSMNLFWRALVEFLSKGKVFALWNCVVRALLSRNGRLFGDKKSLEDSFCLNL